MISCNTKVALILGHPGHELRIFRFLELYKPRVYVLTDGSGSAGQSRIDNTLKIISQTGAKASPVMGRYTDAQIYHLLRKRDTEALATLIEEIMADMKRYNIGALAGDAVEGYNPTHDLCRYLVNAIAGMYHNDAGDLLPNYEFLLDGPPNQCPEDLAGQAITIKLTEGDFFRKRVAAHAYPELREEVEKIYAVYGANPFLTECLWPSGPLDKYKTWTTDAPYYETWGKEKLKTGKYKELISYHEHLLPMAEFLTNYSKTHAGTHNEHLAG